VKLVILGGAGLRTPLFIHGLVNMRQKVLFDEVVLFDNDEERITLLGTLNQYLVQRAGHPFQLSYTTDIREAVRGADFIFAAIRIGQDTGRVNDERIALKHGVVGQETTGPGGFAMALRTIPVMLEYAKVIREEAPNAWLLNFTNPSGLIAQALNDYADIKVIGICDSPSGMVRRLAAHLGVEQHDMHVEYFGLNHLGWVKHVWVNGEDRLPWMIEHYETLRATDSKFSFFDTELIQTIGLIPNEYLYYFYYKTEAVQNQLRTGQTRGEQIQKLNQNLLNILREVVPTGNGEQAFEAYLSTISQRHSTYMSAETSGNLHQHPDRQGHKFLMGGYEEMALSVIHSITTGEPASLIINVRNNGAMKGLQDNDVIETQCIVTNNGCTPLAVGEVPEVAEALITPVKTYERLTVQAAVHGDYQAALNALTIHPLVPSFQVAKNILDDYLEVHRPYLPQFYT
jgi:6-phospho-beta-glucosidase